MAAIAGVRSPTYYDVLGIARDATQEEIHDAYLAKALELHPDRHVNDTADEMAAATTAMAALNEAHHALGDAQRRTAYDLSLQVTSRAAAAGAKTTANYYYNNGAFDSRVGVLGIVLIYLLMLPLLVAILNSNVWVKALWSAAFAGILTLAGAIWYVMRE